MNNLSIIVEVATQQLLLYDGKKLVETFSISTAKEGVNAHKNTDGTPLGLHVICQKIGAGALPNTIFVGRKPLPDLYDEKNPPSEDPILARILWLSGGEMGKNQGGDVDTKSRYIYIHGTPDKNPMGVPLSHGCVRMRNADVVRLFDLVEVGTPVNIVEVFEPPKAPLKG